MTLTVLLHNASERTVKADIAKDLQMIPHKLPVNAFTTKAFSCPRCKGDTFALFKEKYRYICFCLTFRCLSADKDASLAKKNGQPIPAGSKSETGAEHYHLGRVFNEAALSKWIAEEKDVKIVTGWLANPKPFLTVMGTQGTGKTYLSAAILNYLFEKSEEVAYVTHRRFIEEIHHAMQEGKTQHSVMPRYAEKKYLIFDDLGSATCTEWQQEMVLELIDRRYSDKAKTVITTNLNKDELYQKLGKRTASRILDSNNEILEYWSTDRRTTPGYDADEWWKK